MLLVPCTGSDRIAPVMYKVQAGHSVDVGRHERGMESRETSEKPGEG